VSGRELSEVVVDTKRRNITIDNTIVARQSIETWVVSIDEKAVARFTD